MNTPVLTVIVTVLDITNDITKLGETQDPWIHKGMKFFRTKCYMSIWVMVKTIFSNFYIKCLIYRNTIVSYIKKTYLLMLPDNYLDLHIKPFWLCFNIRSTAIQC